MAELHKLAQAMCSIDLAETHWTQGNQRIVINDEKELPRLPVPDLWLTVSRYLASLKAVLAPTETLQEMLEKKPEACKLTSEQIRDNWEKFEHTDQLVRQFMLNEGPQLQRDLKEYANKCQNWATEYWLQDMYLSNALPLPVNSNPFFMFPRQNFATSNEMLMFATRVIQFAVDFKYRIDLQTLKQDFGSGHGKGKPLCMETYKNFFHSYRMPHEHMDRLLPQSRRSNHIVVASCNQFYILRLGQDPLDNPYRNDDSSSQLNESIIFDQLLRIYRVSREHFKRESLTVNSVHATTTTDQQARQPQPISNRIPKVGLFTSENRKTWARLHKKLSHCNGQQRHSSRSSSSTGLNSNGLNSPNTNTESLRQIEDCLFVMCLDSLVGHTNPHLDENNNTNHSLTMNHVDHRHQQEDTFDEVEAANIILTGGGTHLFTANRWFDKFLQIIVGRNGICGINIEHSASEGITVLRFLEEFLDYLKRNPIMTAKGATTASSSALSSCFKFNYGTLDEAEPTDEVKDENNNNKPAKNTNEPPPETKTGAAADSITSPNYVELKSPSLLLEESDKITPLMWTLDDELMEAMDRAETTANQLIQNFSLNILKFRHFGRAFIKNQNLSPDAFVQLALQLTFYKIHGQLVSTYESASLRQFRLGRVDNIRANTCETFQWIQAMLACKGCRQSGSTESGGADEATTRSMKQRAESLFIKAITKQVEILRYTIIGGAPDNHLLALKELAKIRYGPNEDELPELFTDSSYREFLNFRLSTSQLPNESGITVGYGAVVPDGYGCSYNPREHQMVFCISSFKDCPETSSELYAKLLTESLLEMQQLCIDRKK